MKSKVLATLLVTLVLLGLVAIIIGRAVSLPPPERLRIATTTSLYNTGLWSELEPLFENEYRVAVDILSAGTGIALEYGKRGDVDVITVHSRAQEEQFVAEGYGIKRVPFAYNYFLIVGPAADPAGIKNLSPTGAFRRLFETGSGSFVSRGDDSGTHSKEKAIWQQAGFNYKDIQESSWAKSNDSGYIESGSGMGPTLLMASEKQAYTLTDIGTFLSYQSKLNLVPLVDKSSILLNVYTAIAISPEKHPNINLAMANNLINFLTSPEIQQLIGQYGVKQYGRPLFTPGAGTEPVS